MGDEVPGSQGPAMNHGARHGHDVHRERDGDSAADGAPPPGAQNHHAGHAPERGAAAAGPATGHAGHVDHTGHEELFRKRFWISLALTIPVLIYTPAIQEWLGFRAPRIPGAAWIAPLSQSRSSPSAGSPSCEWPSPKSPAAGPE
jgi:Cu2+-exporting ATPase